MPPPHIAPKDIEDDSDNAEALQVLRYWGYEVEVAHDRAGALGRAALRRYDAILLDLGLPTFDDGCSLLRELRGLVAGDHPLVVAARHSRDIHRRRAIEAGCDFFVKPADLDEPHGALGTIDAHGASAGAHAK